MNTDYFLVLHPRHKLTYFKSAGWEEDWINTAETLVCDEFERSYQDMEIEDDDALEMAIDVPARSAVDSSSEVCFSFF